MADTVNVDRLFGPKLGEIEEPAPGAEEVAEVENEPEAEEEHEEPAAEEAESERPRKRTTAERNRERREAKNKTAAALAAIEAAQQQQAEILRALLEDKQRSQVQGFDQAIGQHDQAIRGLEQQIIDAETRGEPTFKLQRQLTALEARRNGLHAQKQQVAAPPVETAERRSVKRPAPAEKFLARHAWFDSDPNTRDADSRKLHAIDAEVMRDGFDPKSQAYYDECELRAAKELPHRFARQRTTTSPVAGSGRSSGGSTTAGPQIKLKAERERAMREIGIEPGSERWKKMIARYAAEDRANAGE